MSEINSIIVVGASAGGLKAISELLSVLPATVVAPIFIVLHVSRKSDGEILVSHLQKRTKLECVLPSDGEIIKAGHVYIATPDYHLLVTAKIMRVIKGPHENRWRPSIDVLFRSAAAAFDAGAVGIILTGLLDDGTAGMSAIKRSKGICIVQEPVEAEFGDMPANVLKAVDVDYRVPIADMGYILDDITAKNRAKRMNNVPEDITLENRITERMVTGIEDLEKLGTKSDFTCPDCGGGLWLMKNETFPRYRCFTGHVYSDQLLLDKQDESLEESLWISVRMMEERKHLLETTAYHHHQLGNSSQEEEKTGQARELQFHIDRIKELIKSLSIGASANNGGFE